MCFATSGKKILTDFLGSDYAGYGGAYASIIAVPALILALHKKTDQRERHL